MPDLLFSCQNCQDDKTCRRWGCRAHGCCAAWACKVCHKPWWVCGVDHRRCIETGMPEGVIYDPYIVDIDRLNAVFQAAKKVCEVKIITKDSLGLEVLQDLRAAVREAENV